MNKLDIKEMLEEAIDSGWGDNKDFNTQLVDKINEIIEHINQLSVKSGELSTKVVNSGHYKKDVKRKP